MISRREFFSRVAAAFAAGLVTALPEKSSAGKAELMGIDWGAGESVVRSFLVRFPDKTTLQFTGYIRQLANGNLGVHPTNSRELMFINPIEIDSDQLVALDDRCGEIRDKPTLFWSTMRDGKPRSLNYFPPIEIEQRAS